MQLEFFCFVWVSKQRGVSNSTQFMLEANKLAGYFGNDLRNYTRNQTSSKFLRHFTQGHKSDASLHAACMLQAPLLEAWLQLAQQRRLIQHPGKTVLWKQVLLGLQRCTKLPSDCNRSFHEVIVQRRNKCRIWPRCLLAVEPSLRCWCMLADALFKAFEN